MSALDSSAVRDALHGVDISASVESLYTQLLETAVARDQRGGHAHAERQAIRTSGLLGLGIPKALGGLGVSWSVIYKAIRRLAEADSALAHVFAFHHLQVASIQFYGTHGQQARLLTLTQQQQLFWGNALNPLDKRATVVEHGEGSYILHGPKNYCSGSVGSDYLLASGWHAASQSAVVVVVPSTRAGVSIASDWDAFGQRQTDSGTVQFDNVVVQADEVLQGPGVTRTPLASLRTQVSQLILTNLYLGLARGAFDAARVQIRDHTRPSFFSTAATASQDPFIQHRVAELWLLVKPATLMADDAARQLDAALARGADLTAEERGEVAITVNEAKALAHKASLEVSTQFFELTGARATSQSLGLDRFWRNARVHTLHDPIDYKYRDIGRYLLEGQYPEPTPYS
ncbi:MAG: acyl-CoA dehydrogenase family protein [Pseudomonadota bacterium]